MRVVLLVALFPVCFSQRETPPEHFFLQLRGLEASDGWGCGVGAEVTGCEGAVAAAALLHDAERDPTRLEIELRPASEPLRGEPTHMGPFGSDYDDNETPTWSTCLDLPGLEPGVGYRLAWRVTQPHGESGEWLQCDDATFSLGL